MKLDNDRVLGVQTPPRKSYNPFDSDDEMEAPNGYLKGSLNEYDIKSFETNDNSLTFHLNSSDLSWEEAILSHSQILSRTVPADSNGEEVQFRKDTELFTDKTVTDSELPEMMDYYKENAYNSVKDIGIDEGMPVHDKVSIKSRDNHGSKNTSFLGLNGHINGDEHLELPYMEGLKSRADSNSEKYVYSPNRSNDFLKESGLDNEALKTQQIADQTDIDDSAKVNGLKHNSSKEQSTSSRESTGVVVQSGSVVSSTRDPQLSKEDGESYPKLVKEKNPVSEDQAHESSSMPSIANGAEASAESSESRNTEATTSQSAELPASQDSSDIGNSLSYNSKVESGSIILDFNSSNETFAEPAEARIDNSAVGKEEKKEDEGEKGEEKGGKDEEENSQHNETFAKPPEVQSMSRHNEGPSSSIFNSGSDNLAHGETIFSTAIAAPASITYMGAHAHTGNISLRSESSAGSTHSFAFPVLQAEWNSSPVRMAKAEQRSFRGHRGWFHSLMCCRF